jgi:hypothetical protein
MWVDVDASCGCMHANGCGWDACMGCMQTARNGSSTCMGCTSHACHSWPHAHASPCMHGRRLRSCMWAEKRKALEACGIYTCHTRDMQAVCMAHACMHAAIHRPHGRHACHASNIMHVSTTCMHACMLTASSTGIRNMHIPPSNHACLAKHAPHPRLFCMHTMVRACAHPCMRCEEPT